MIRRFVIAVASAFLAVASTMPAVADTVAIDVLHPYAGHKRFHEPIAAEFMKRHPDIKIVFRAPAANYNEGHQGILRDTVTGRLPDVWHSGYHMLPELVTTFSKRGRIVELTPLMSAEGDERIKANYSAEILKHGSVDGRQWGMPFNASTPIAFYNLDLVTKAGADPAHLPKSWDEVIALAKKVSSASDGIDGMAYSVSEWGDDYLWQALIYNFGGEMMDPAKTKVLFGGEAGLKAVTLARRFVAETGMPFMTEDQSVQQFAAGKLGILFASTSLVRGAGDMIGSRFRWKTAPYPIADREKGGVTTGGNAMVILASDPAKQKAAWAYIKFATGPVGQTIAVRESGYMPTNLKALEPDHLGKFYEANPDWTTSVNQWPVARLWFGYPGASGVGVWREQRAILSRIMRAEVTPEAGLADLVAATERLARQ